MNKNSYIALILLILISVKSLLVPAIYLDFEIRKDFIIKNLCENRFKPQLKCNGACYLAKKMNQIAENKATNETNKQSNFIKKVMEEVYEVKQNQTFLFCGNLLQKNSFTQFITVIKNNSNKSIFRPPIA